ARGVYHGRGAELPAVRADAGDLPVRARKGDDLGAFDELGAAVAGTRDVAVEEARRVRVAILRAERGEADVVGTRDGTERLRLRRIDAACRDAEALPELERALERRAAAVRRDEEEEANRMEVRVDANFFLERLDAGNEPLREPEVDLAQDLK